jgi:hypothetical protein
LVISKIGDLKKHETLSEACEGPLALSRVNKVDEKAKKTITKHISPFRNTRFENATECTAPNCAITSTAGAAKP